MKLGSILLSCEHAVNRVPARYDWLFSQPTARAELETHLGYDIGALTAAKTIASELGIELHTGTITRLLVDLNRSRPQAFNSKYCQQLEETELVELADRYHQSHWKHVFDSIEHHDSPVCHIGVHSFTPVYEGEARNADIGLLYDPSRPNEQAFCATWEATLRRQDPSLRLRHNYPYLGTSDGMTTSLRKKFNANHYLGIELELNQSIFLNEKAQYQSVINSVAISLAQAFQRHQRH